MTERMSPGAFEDLTWPAERTFGFYLIKVDSSDRSQVVRAAHPTAKRLARSRTQYGGTELSFLGAIDTPALAKEAIGRRVLRSGPEVSSFGVNFCH
jgi:hypothetical protein